MIPTQAEPADVTRAASGSSRRVFWGAMLENAAYTAVSGLLLGSRRRQIALLASLPLLWIAFANVGPIAQMVWISFLDSYPPRAGYVPQMTLANWARFFQEQIFLVPYFRTLGYAAVFTVATLIITYPVAYFLAKHVKRSNQLLFLLLLLIPFWVGEIVRTFAIMILLGNNGAINIALRSLGLIDRPIPFMYTTFSLGVGIIYLTALYMLLPLYSALEKIPNSYREAAADLGAGPWTRFWRVILPLSREGIASGCTLVFLISTGYYAAPVLLGGPGTTVFAETIAGFFHVAGDQWPTGAAFSTIMLISALVITGLFLKLMSRGGTGLMK
ncbi:ABC transporter permease [Marinivivus vitaminiproducens]|uniref:ABC transporter permease n=1 Tax=Marinivivus vitaminiproducens TaxID=3035935 RepID=UPI00279FA03E|nr:ABC transporter permease [Geminicoccaceae bacterium SCSIO 64248]